MRKNNFRELVRQRFTGIHESPACCENHVASVFNALSDCVFDCCRVRVVNVILADNLRILKTQILLHSLNAKVMGVGISAALCGVCDVDNANL